MAKEVEVVIDRDESISDYTKAAKKHKGKYDGNFNVIFCEFFAEKKKK